MNQAPTNISSHPGDYSRLPLALLAREAVALAQGEPGSGSPEQEVARQLQICNACRYCEGFCAVFPAMTRRLEFPAADVHYLANLCHNCGACLHACQYAPPHEFQVNIPRAMARVRGRTYALHAWPAGFGRLYQRNGLVVALVLAFTLAAFLLLGAQSQGSLWQALPAGGNYYSVFPHGWLVNLFVPVFLLAVLALGIGLSRFWRGVTPATSGQALGAEAAISASQEALTLKYLDGGHGDGCHEEDEAYTLRRRRFHHFTFYGFGLCFAATAVGTLYHYLLGWHGPHDFPSLPKLLGAVGGVSLLVGSLGLGWLRLQRHPLHGDAAQKPMDMGFISLLALVSASGLGLWASRDTPALTLLLCVHLGAVMALFLTLPYGKFGHGFYRLAALLRHNVERRLPNPIGLGSE